MCGRCRCSIRPDDVPRACHIPTSSVAHVDLHRYQPMYNVSPGSYLPVLRRENGGDEGHKAVLHSMKWGLIPSFTKKDDKPDHYRMFNARSESISEKASFRRLIPNNRCLVAVEGFYEWKKGPKKQPYYIHFKDAHHLVFAALYDSWKNAEGEIIYTFTILTTQSSPALQWLHDRMPVILGDKASIDIWLNGSSDPKYSAVLKPYENPDLVWYPVSSAMNKMSFDGPECIKEIVLKEHHSNPITNFFSKKEVSNDIESRSVVRSSRKESSPTDLKDKIMEPETQYSFRLSSAARKSDSETETNSDVSTYSPTSEIKVEGKRNFEEILDNSEANINKVGQPPQTPVKKLKVKGRAEKQASLRSYFTKT